MRRRSVLVACGTGLAGVAGCLGEETDGSDGASTTEPASTRSTAGADAAATETTGSSGTPTARTTTAEDAFRAVVEKVADRVVELSTAGDTWHVEYHFDVCCGERFEDHQAKIATEFAELRTGDVALTARVHHECQVVEWGVPAQLAGEYERGEIGEAAFVERVLETSEKTDTC